MTQGWLQLQQTDSCSMPKQNLHRLPMRASNLQLVILVRNVELQAAGNLALRISSRLPRYSERYTIVVSDQAKHKPNLANLWKSSPR